MKNLILSIIVAIAMVLGVSTEVLAQTQTLAIAEIQGNITAVDPMGKTVTITPDSGTAVTLNVTDRTQIEVPGKDAATLADFKMGQWAKAKYEISTKNALEIKVKEIKAAKIQGEITSLDSAAKKVTITPKQEETVVLAISDRTEIEVWGKEPAGFPDLNVGDSVKAEYDLITKDALEIEVKAKGEPSLAVRQGFFGTVKAKTDTFLSLITKQGDVTFTLDATTQFWNPPQKDTTLADIKVGDRAAVLAVRQDSTLLAKRVLVIPPKPVRIQVTGTVSKVAGNTVTLTDKEGNTFTPELSKGLAAKVEVGDVIVLTLLRTPGVEKYIAEGLMRGEEMRERLNSFLEKVKGRRAGTEEERGERAKDLEKLGGLLQRNMEGQQQILQQVLQKAPPQVREALERAKEKSLRGWAQAKETLEKEKGEPAATRTPPGKERP